ncbi:unnamed protein product [Gadus morhua 'NCC']
MNLTTGMSDCVSRLRTDARSEHAPPIIEGQRPNLVMEHHAGVLMEIICSSPQGSLRGGGLGQRVPTKSLAL